MIEEFASWFVALTFPEQVVALAFAVIGVAFLSTILDRR